MIPIEAEQFFSRFQDRIEETVRYVIQLYQLFNEINSLTYINFTTIEK